MIVVKEKQTTDFDRTDQSYSSAMEFILPLSLYKFKRSLSSVFNLVLVICLWLDLHVCVFCLV